MFLDPGAYCTGLLQESASAQDRCLEVNVEGDVVSRERVVGFARSYLGAGSSVS